MLDDMHVGAQNKVHKMVRHMSKHHPFWSAISQFW